VEAAHARCAARLLKLLQLQDSNVSILDAAQGFCCKVVTIQKWAVSAVPRHVGDMLVHAMSSLIGVFALLFVFVSCASACVLGSVAKWGAV